MDKNLGKRVKIKVISVKGKCDYLVAFELGTDEY